MHAGIGTLDNKGNQKKQLFVVATKTHKQHARFVVGLGLCVRLKNNSSASCLRGDGLAVS